MNGFESLRGIGALEWNTQHSDETEEDIYVMILSALVLIECVL